MITSALIGYQMSKNCSTQHIQVNNSNIQLLDYSAGIIGIATFNQILLIKNQGSGQTSAGLIGMTEQSTLNIQNIFVCNVSISSVDKASSGILGSYQILLQILQIRIFQQSILQVVHMQVLLQDIVEQTIVSISQTQNHLE
ncbi:Hypothetical_protein [Hexamita inflata]|uniref:Hypothetical_protein n=1 Tax=Hexamita inflata TaxID=28002 RepID=A0AA86QDP1_9EUKA|nr:Hypothetical protein HINF_LOCUS37780 [Hexamita inflata]